MVMFTRYHLPNGRKEQVEYDLPEELSRKAAILKDAGFHFEVETLTTGEQSWTVGDDDGDYHFVIVGPEVSNKDAIASLISGAYDLHLVGTLRYEEE